MLAILYDLFYTERKKQQQQPTHENTEGGGGERSEQEAVQKVCIFQWGEGGGED